MELVNLSIRTILYIIHHTSYIMHHTLYTIHRATVKFFKHNDMADLRTLLEAIREDDRKLKRDTSQQRRFIVVEGIYRYGAWV